MSERPKGWTPKILEGGISDDDKPPYDDIAYLQSDIGAVLATSAQVNDIIGTLAKLGPIKAKEIEDETARLPDRLEALIIMIHNSTETQWKAKPALYKALVQVWGDRMTRLRQWYGE